MLNIAGKARPIKEQIMPLVNAGFSYYEAVIFKHEDWNGLEQVRSDYGMIPVSISPLGSEEEKRWEELPGKLSCLDMLADSGALDMVYIAVDGFPDNIERFSQKPFFSLENTALEALPATTPSAVEFKTAYPKDLIEKAKATNSKVLIDMCHLAQTAVMDYILANGPLHVIANKAGTFKTIIPVSVGERYYALFEHIAQSGLMAPFAHFNGHVFVAHPDLQDTVLLANGQPVKAFDNKPQTRADWANERTYGKNSYSVPIRIGGRKQYAHWFATHQHFSRDELFTFLDIDRVIKQAIDSGIEFIVLEVPKDSISELKADAMLILDAAVRGS